MLILIGKEAMHLTCIILSIYENSPLVDTMVGWQTVVVSLVITLRVVKYLIIACGRNGTLMHSMCYIIVIVDVALLSNH
jgi:hypothetical protein